ncbi:MAG: NAD(P)-dependent oxidoreductase [Candidatus Obscuribacterales bacterium]|nr:NAD(P)-dependent oxidoreductase [Candidatus Obscuribacterales bacterium]
MAERIIITGGTGLIGSHVTKALVGAGHHVTTLARTRRFSVPDLLTKEELQSVEIVQGDMCDAEVVIDLVGSADVIFHKAANQGVFAAVENTQEFVQTNVGSAATLVDALKRAKKRPRLVVLGSSISVYGEGVYQCETCGPVRPRLRYRKPVATTSTGIDWNPPCPKCGAVIEPIPATEEAERLGESVYAVTKKTQEDLLAGACNLLDISFVSLRYCTIIGAGQSWHSPITHFLDLLSGSQAPVLHEDGLQMRDFIFLDDVIQANLLALTKARSGSAFYNVGSGKQSSLLDISKRLGILVSERLNQPFVEAQVDQQFVPGDVRHCYVSCEKIRDELGFTTQKDFSQELSQLVDWYLRKRNVALNAPSS